MSRIDTRHNQNNEIVKRKFFEQLEHARNGKDPKTVDQYIKAIHEFEIFTGFKDFKKFSSDLAIEFKAYLGDKFNQRTGEPISKSFYFHYLSHSFIKCQLLWRMHTQTQYLITLNEVSCIS